MSSTSSVPMATGRRWWSVRRPFAVAPLFLLFVPIGYVVPGLVVALPLAAFGGLGDELYRRWMLAFCGRVLTYFASLGICARLAYTAFKAKPVKHLRAAIWGGMCCGALPMSLSFLFAIVMWSILAVVSLLKNV